MVNWSPEMMREVELIGEDAFLKVRETLTRIGIASHKDKCLFQTAHLLHKKGKYYIVHFKELFLLDHKNSTLTEDDIERRDTITHLLEEWNLVKSVNPLHTRFKAYLPQLKVVPYDEKSEWKLVPKYLIGNHKKKAQK